MSERNCQPLTVQAAIDALAAAIKDVSAQSSDISWSKLYDALVPFKDPLEGGVFSIADIDEAFFAILESGVMQRVYFLRDMTQTQWNSHAIDAAASVCVRITDIIACSQEVNEKCYAECGSPESRCLSPIPKCK